MMEYFLSWWGGCEATVKLYHNIDNNLWFNTEVDRNKILNILNKYRYLGLNYRTCEGKLKHKKTIAVVKLKYKQRNYIIHVDFGYEYLFKNILWMFQEGNYSCDCNKSIFINNEYNDIISEMDCGNEIKLRSIQVVYK